MKSLARWSFVFVAALSISSFGIQPQVEEASVRANDSQGNTNQENQVEKGFLAASTENPIVNSTIPDSNLTIPDSSLTTDLIAEDSNSITEDSSLITEDSDEFQTTTPSNQTNTQTAQTDDKNKLVKKTGMVERKSAVRTFRATAYCLKGRMANGGAVRRGVVAADTRFLPLGTKIYLNAGPYSGTYTVSDTGGAVRGNVLDVWVPSCSEANRFGRRTVTLSVVN